MADITRDYWVEAIQEKNVQFVEKLIELLNKEVGYNFTLGYTQSYICAALAGKNCHILNVRQSKKGMRLSIQVKQTELFDRILKNLAVDGEITYGTDGWYVLFITNQIPTSQLVTVLAQSAIECGYVQSFNATADGEISTVESKKDNKEGKQRKYWIFVEMNMERHYQLDVEQALKAYDYKTVEELLENEGDSPFYGQDDSAFYIAKLLGVAVVKTKPNKELYEYFDARGEGFDYDYVDGYNWNYERAPWPEDSEGVLGIEKNYPAIVTFELLTTEEFDPEKLSIDGVNEISYDGNVLDPINTQGDPTDFEMYINGEIVQ